MSRVQCPWYRRGEGAKVIRPAKSGAPEVGARAAWPSLAVLPPWFRRWRRPMAQRPGAAAAYEEALLAEAALDDGETSSSGEPPSGAKAGDPESPPLDPLELGPALPTPAKRTARASEVALSRMPGRCYHPCWCCMDYEEEPILRCCFPRVPHHVEHVCQCCLDDIYGAVGREQIDGRRVADGATLEQQDSPDTYMPQFGPDGVSGWATFFPAAAKTDELDRHHHDYRHEPSDVGAPIETARTGIATNRVCACCGSPMEQNRAYDSTVHVEYCHRCGREPLCAGCSYFEFGWPAAIDLRWARLTERALRIHRRTVRGQERSRLVTCCFCMHIVGDEHINPERPLPISDGRPEGWLHCDQCVLFARRHNNGALRWHHYCPRHGRQSGDTQVCIASEPPLSDNKKEAPVPYHRRSAQRKGLSSGQRDAEQHGTTKARYHIEVRSECDTGSTPCARRNRATGQAESNDGRLCSPPPNSAPTRYPLLDTRPEPRARSLQKREPEEVAGGPKG